jgi:hypothetical protein
MKRAEDPEFTKYEQTSRDPLSNYEQRFRAHSYLNCGSTSRYPLLVASCLTSGRGKWSQTEVRNSTGHCSICENVKFHVFAEGL